MGEIIGQERKETYTNIYGVQYNIPNGLQVESTKFRESVTGLIVPEHMLTEKYAQSIILSGEIGQEMYDGLVRDISRIEGDPNVSCLDIKLSTCGGLVDSGLAIYDFLDVYKRTYGVGVRITAYGPVMSMGVLLLQVGDLRRMSKNSMMMLHDIHLSEASSLSTDDLRAHAEDLEEEQRLYMDLIAKRARLGGVKSTTIRTVGSLCKKNGTGTYLSAQEAKRYGFVDEVI